jgi:hypothetical protein
VGAVVAGAANELLHPESATPLLSAALSGIREDGRPQAPDLTGVLYRAKGNARNTGQSEWTGWCVCVCVYWWVGMSHQEPLASETARVRALDTAVSLSRNAPMAPRKPSCRMNMAWCSPLDQNLMAYEIVSMVYGWPRMKNPPNISRCSLNFIAFSTATCHLVVRRDHPSVGAHTHAHKVLTADATLRSASPVRVRVVELWNSEQEANDRRSLSLYLTNPLHHQPQEGGGGGGGLWRCAALTWAILYEIMRSSDSAMSSGL